MARLLIGWKNHADAAALAGGSWLAELPLANTRDRRLHKVARTEDLALVHTQLTLDTGAAVYVDLLGLLANNLTRFARVRITASYAAGFAPLNYDSGWLDAYPEQYPSHQLNFEDSNWFDGRIRPEDIAGSNRHFVHVIQPGRTGRHWRIEIDDNANAEGQVDIGRLFLGAAWQPSVNFSWGSAMGIEDQTREDRALGGQLVFDAGARSRTLRLSLDHLATEESLNEGFELIRRQGRAGELLVVPDYEDTVHAHQRNLWARMRRLGELERYQHGLNRQAYAFEELL